MFEFLTRAKRMFLDRTLVTSIVAPAALPQPSPTQTVTQLPVQEVEERPAGEGLIGPYAQPRWSARGRFSADTDVYVLPPYSFYFDLDYDGTFPRKGQPDHLFVQEYEPGLPCRFQIAWEFYQEAINGHRQIPFTLIEGRYAFADWGKIPLNPTLLAEFKWGNESQPGKRHLARNIFELGPAFTYKPSPHTRIDVAPLAGLGHDSPYLETFLIFSIDFGTGETRESEEPASTHFHR